MKFVKFTEHNDNEGESWNFWLQKDGNEEQLKHLADLILSDGDFYCLLNEEVDESEVDVLVKHTDSGYMNYQNKVVGVLDLSNCLHDPENDEDAFYKGGIEHYFNDKED